MLNKKIIIVKFCYLIQKPSRRYNRGGGNTVTLVSQIEAILFVVGEEGIGLEELAYLLEKSTAKTYEELTKLKEHYASDNKSALNILEVGNHFVLTTKKNMPHY